MTARLPLLRLNHRLIHLVLMETQRRFGIQLRAFAVMPNHLHLIVKVQSRKQWGDALRFFFGQVALKMNRGKLWSQRALSRMVKAGRDYSGAVDYVWRNPYKARIAHPIVDSFWIVNGLLFWGSQVSTSTGASRRAGGLCFPMIPRSDRPHTLICIHGFLGQPKDWDHIFDASQNPERPTLYRVDLQKDFAQADLPEKGDAFQAWAEHFGAQITQSYQNSPVRPILLGYSLGGRLAMNALVRFPDLFAGAILVSANPGLHSQAIEERKARIDSDEKWARRFAPSHGPVEPWSDLMQAWNNQAVFQGGRAQPERREEDFDRKTLAAQLRQWSLGKQRDLLPELAQVEVPLLWIAGERDGKYADQAREVEGKLGQRAPAEVWIAPEAGHRVPWDQPELFKSRVQDWIFRAVLGR